jgi:hypothetical protein
MHHTTLQLTSKYIIISIRIENIVTIPKSKIKLMHYLCVAQLVPNWPIWHQP